MKKIFVLLSVIALGSLLFQGCQPKTTKKELTKEDSVMQSKVNEYATVKLISDLSKLSEKEKQLIVKLIEIAKIMDDLYWQQTLGDKKAFLDSIKSDYEKQFALINYGPWDRLDDNKPFIAKYGEKPAGANFYPQDMTKEEFEKFDNKDKTNLYTVIRRNEDKSLKVVWYQDEYKEQLQKASELLKKASELAEDEGLKKYLELRSEALITSNYQPSDMAWMDMKTNRIDFVVGPIEN
ncbi:MAG TPA: Zn-dependent hydrolase, partial [Candidatus Paceibacterota bacterium]|nr:Zn-dependent hydrolase [Candidatus Paceibacterota bacterium]